MIAFEFDTMKSNFELKEPQDLLNVNAIIGVTSSFGGPMASRLDSAVIKGQKINNSTRYITIKRKSKLNNSNIEGVFRVAN
jgi:hypothetical protein